MALKLSVVVCPENADALSWISDDDDVFVQGSTMSQSMMKSTVTIQAENQPSKMYARRSSLFEVAHHRPGPCGSSVMSFACEPRIDEEGFQIARQKKIQYENTYHMEPPVKFKSDPVVKIIKDVLNTNLQDKSYEPMMGSILSKTLAQEIKQKVKELDFKRYKIVSIVTIGEKKDQDVRAGSRCVWDAAWDTSASANFENSSIYAIGIVYALYYE